MQSVFFHEFCMWSVDECRQSANNLKLHLMCVVEYLRLFSRFKKIKQKKLKTKLRRYTVVQPVLMYLIC